MNFPCGLEVVLVSPFLPPENEEDLKIQDTCGQTSSDSSQSADLQLCLESRLRVRMAEFGSQEYVLIWKHWDMQSGQPICALRASRHRTSDRDCIGWPTPSARDYRDLSKKGVAYAASRICHQPSTVTTAYIRGFVTPQIPALLNRLMGYLPQWDRCAPMGTPSFLRSRRNS